MTIRNLFLAALFLSSTNVSAGNSYHELPLQSEEGVKITVAYNLMEGTTTSYGKTASYAYASPLGIIVQHSELKSSDKIRAVLIDRSKFYGSCASL